MEREGLSCTVCNSTQIRVGISGYTVRRGGKPGAAEAEADELLALRTAEATSYLGTIGSGASAMLDAYLGASSRGHHHASKTFNIKQRLDSDKRSRQYEQISRPRCPY